jgi:predicted nucleotidyltransferase
MTFKATTPAFNSAACFMPRMGITMPTMGMKKTSRARKTAGAKATRSAAPERTTMADALFTATQQRVLGLLFGQPDRSFFATELIALAGAGSGAVQRELKRLAESGLVTVTRLGNQKHYQANRAAPVFEELQGIARKMLGAAEVLRKALALHADRLQAAWLYGSVAKGSGRAESDIDVLIVSDKLTLEEVYAALGPAEKKLGRTVSPTLYTLKEFQRRREAGNPFLRSVFAGNPVPLVVNRDVAGLPG